MAVNFHEETNVLTILIFFILISLGGAVSIVGAASHVTSGHTSNPTTQAASRPFVGIARTDVYLYLGCY